MWDERDVAYFRQSDYARILFVGDLAGYRHRGGVSVARSIAGLGDRALVMPGNHDGVLVSQLVAEVVGHAALIGILSAGQEVRCAEVHEALGPAVYCGYDAHVVESNGVRVTIIAGRPHTMGGPRLGFAPYLSRAYGIRSMDESARRLERLVDEAEPPILFFAHNGPSGLGARRSDIWGCDFRRAEGDWGDPDLERAVAHAVASEKRVLAVVAGHMHHRLKGGGERVWQVERDGTLYVNAARVPRAVDRSGRKVRHHVKLETDGESVRIDEVLARV